MIPAVALMAIAVAALPMEVVVKFRALRSPYFKFDL